jgi:hypothetical protein
MCWAAKLDTLSRKCELTFENVLSEECWTSNYLTLSFIYCYAECHNASCRYSDCRYDECRYT